MPSFTIDSAKKVIVLVIWVTIFSVVLSVCITLLLTGGSMLPALVVPLIVAPLASGIWGFSVLRAYQRFTEQKARADEQQLKSEAYEAAIANLTHDLKSPLAIVTGLLDLLSERFDDEPRELSMAQTQSKRLVGMIDDVLDLTREEMGQAEAFPRVFNPNEMFAGLTAEFEFIANIKKLDFRFENMLTIQTAVLDDRRLNRIVSNLVDNAIKYTNKGHVCLAVSNSPTDAGNSTICIKVSDTGIGIPDGQLENIFEKFGRAQNHYAVDGLGIGLALVRRFTQLLGGSVEIESSENEGTTFTLSVPCQVIKSRRMSALSSLLEDGARRMSVLLVEDDPVNMELTSGVVGNFADVAQSVNGADALEQVIANKYDWIVMDCRMPVMDGIQATRAIRKHEQETNSQRVPIIGLTANASAEESARALAAGMDVVYEKPMTLEKVRACIRDYHTGA